VIRLRRRGRIAATTLMIIAGLTTAVAVRGGVQTPPAQAATTPAVSGTDVSNLTTVTSWQQVKAAGMAFTGVMAYDGASVSNPSYQQEVTGALGAGLYVMPYVVADPLKVATGGDQFSDHAWAAIDSIAADPYQAGGQYLPIALDLESQPQVTPKYCYGLIPAQMVSWISGFVAAAKAKTGVSPVLYSNPNWWRACTGNSKAFAAADPLWIADYEVASPAIPPGWAGYTFWQSSQTAAVSGIKGPADLDLMQAAPAVTAGRGAGGSVQLETLNSLAGQQVTYTATGSLPSYLSLSPGGRLAWSSSTPVGIHSVTATPAGAVTPVPTSTASATSTAGPAPVIPSSVTATVRVHGAIALSSANRSSTAGDAVWLRLAASGTDQNAGSAPALKASGLPNGLSMTAAGVITGWPSRLGTYAVKVTAADGLGGTGSAAFTWTVKAAADAGPAGQIRQAGGSGKCLDDPSGKTANGTVIDLSSCTGRASQRWTTVADGTLRTGGKCLNVAANSTSTGARLELEPCNAGNGAQLWQAATDGQLVNPQSGKCLDVPVASAANGTKPVIHSCANSAGQPNEHWLRPAAAIASGQPGKCAAPSGSAAVLATCANTSGQHWQPQPDGTLRLNGECLLEAGTAARSILSVGSCSFGAAARWKLVAAGPIATELVNAASGLCAAVPASGTRLALAACAAAPSTSWHLE
jgi:GH25 family lysozyme M1 (1,4-beta-N-acetylmuramidase)